MNTNKIIKYTLIISLILIIGVFAIYFYTLTTQKDIEGFEDFKNTYIFGRSSTDSFDSLGAEDSQIIDIDISGDVVIPKLRKITSEPVSGFFIYQNEGKTFVRYTERATGHIYESNNQTITQKRLSNTTIPKIYESVWLGENSSIIRYLDESDNIKSFYAEIIEGEIEGVFLPDNIKEILAVGNQIFYLLIDNNGSRGILSKPNGDNKDQIFDSPVTEWLVQRPSKGMLTFTTKPSANVPGYLYFFDTNTEKSNMILRGVLGLTTLTNTNKTLVLFSRSLRNTFSLNLYDVNNERTKQMPIQTLPEKCVWSSDKITIYCGAPLSVEGGSYPDVWYQGLISFSDSIWKINTKDISLELIISPEDEIDMIKPQLNEEETYLFFINKKDLSLWSLEL